MNHIIPEDKLKTTTLGDLTQSQIYDTSSATFIPQRSALEDLILIHKAKKALATFGGGGCIPSKGDVQTTTVTDIPLPAASTMKPAVGEVWRMDFGMLTVANGSAGSNTISLQVEDGITSTFQISGTVAGGAVDQPFDRLPFWLTAPLYIRITSSSGDESLVTLPVQYEAM